MGKIYLDDINLDELHQINDVEHKESALFHDKNTVYKIFDDLNNHTRNSKQNKIELLSNGQPLPITIMPRDELVYEFLNNRFEGYTMDYITDSKTLYKTFLKTKDIQKIFQIINTISISLEEIHRDPRNIVISDLHAENIIIDKKYNPYIVDIDSCKIDGIKNDAIPMMLKKYLLNRLLFETETTKNTDRLCLIMMTLGIIFNKNIDRISMIQYDEISEQIETLKNMRELVLDIKKSTTVPEVPYFHELIKESNITTKRLIK